MSTKTLISALAMFLVVPAAVSAQAFVGPSIGGTFGANVGRYDFGPRPSVGVGIGWLGRGNVGVEFEATLTPDFYDLSDVRREVGVDVPNESRLLTVMAALIVSTRTDRGRTRSVRPYAAIGAGMVRSHLDTGAESYFQLNDTDVGMVAGGGALFSINDNVAFRADLRYFRIVANRGGPQLRSGTFADTLEGLGFLRPNVAVIFRFRRW